MIKVSVFTNEIRPDGELEVVEQAEPVSTRRSRVPALAFVQVRRHS